jgi:hypothetical protein
MILHAVELAHVGRFRETVRLGPLAPGVNVLAAPNEAGKSTALLATARALFDRHSTRAEEIKALQPAGTDLAPRVRVEFETREGRFRLEKTFLAGAKAQLARWEDGAWRSLAEADAADQRVQALLRTTLPGRGATKPEHWGLLAFLWARQEERAEWPRLGDSPAGQEVRAKLARIELDPAIERLDRALSALLDPLLTDRGQMRTGGALAQAEADLRALQTELDEIARQRAAQEDTRRRHRVADETVSTREAELVRAGAEAATLQAQALEAERVTAELATRSQALEAERARLAAIVTDTAARERLAAESVSVRRELARSDDAAAQASADLGRARERLHLLDTDRPAREGELARLRRGSQRHVTLLRLRQLEAGARQLTEYAAEAERLHAAVAHLEAAKTRLPDLAPAALKKLEQLQQTARDAQAHLEALGLTVELRPDATRQATLDDGSGDDPRTVTLPGGATSTLQSPRHLDLTLAGWGRILIRSGAVEARTAAERLVEAERAFRMALEQAGVPTLEAAREAVAERRSLETQLKAANTELTPKLRGLASLEALRAAAEAERRRAATAREVAAPTTEEDALSGTELEATEARRAVDLGAREKDLKEADAARERARTEERAAQRAAEEAARAAADQRVRIAAAEAQERTLLDRYADGLEAALKAAQLAFAQAEGRVLEARSRLPTDAALIPGRHLRAVRALREIETELTARRAERDQTRGALEILGGQGLYSRETELTERRAEAQLRRDAARSRAWSARIARDLIRRHKDAATRAVLAPLQRQLNAAFSELTGETGREVFLDESLGIAGIGRTREEAYPFEQLSAGAKEQLLLCLRLAVAETLALDEPQVLILDDVLTHTDPGRQQRVIDALERYGQTLQIIIATCHPERYRALGRALAFEALVP